MKLKTTTAVFAILFLVTCASAAETTRLPGVWGNVTRSDGTIIPGARVVLNVTSWAGAPFTSGVLYNEVKNTTTNSCGLYYFTDANAPSAVEGKNNTLIVRAYEHYRVGVNLSVYGDEDWPDATIRLDLNATRATNGLLDVGNDSWEPWEWNYSGELPDNYTTTVDLNPDKLNFIIANGCKRPQCPGCFLNLTTMECSIPLRLMSDTPGILQIYNIHVSGWGIRTLESVEYGMPFFDSSGANWTMRYMRSPIVSDFYSFKIPRGYAGGDLFNYTHTSNPAIGGGGTHDALDDAIWRLLYKLDNESNVSNNIIDNVTAPGGDIFFNETTMEFEAHSRIGASSLWGPAIAKLIVWV